MKTIDVKLLALEVLESLPRPFTEDVIDDVFYAIETNPEWLKRYEKECSSLGKTVVNTRCGYWIANALDRCGEKSSSAKKSKLIETYSLLDTDASLAREPTEDEARKLMSDYYRDNKVTLPAEIQKLRAQILKRITRGVPVAEAFILAMSDEELE
jgi:hypothetical protein